MKIVREHLLIVFLFSAIVSLGFIMLTDRFFFNLFGGETSTLAIVADIRLTSLAILLIAYQWLKKILPVDHYENHRLIRRTVWLSMAWLILTAYFVLVKKVWVPSLQTWADVIAFMITGVVAEEILFRGIIFDLTRVAFKARGVLAFSTPVLMSSLLFGLQHLSYHGFQITPASITQVLYTTLMGMVFASIREASGRLWPVVGFHMLNNLFTLIRNFG